MTTTTENPTTARRFVRGNDRVLAGLCSGIAGHFGWDVTITRIACLSLAILTLPGSLVVYLVAWWLARREERRPFPTGQPSPRADGPYPSPAVPANL